MSIVCEQWTAALAGMEIRHLDHESRVLVEVRDGPPTLSVAVEGAVDTDTGKRRYLAVSSVELTYFPGEIVARRWLAAAWAGYVQHEALELVRHRGVRPLDPHADIRIDRGLRCGFPTRLTPASLVETLLLVVSPTFVDELMENG